MSNSLSLKNASSLLGGGLFFAILFFSFASSASAATYYMRADGTAANAAAAIGPDTDSTKCMSVATHNSQTFSAGDTIYLSDKGGDYAGSTRMIIPSSGTGDSNRITYDKAPGESPVINMPLVSQPIDISGKSWVTVQNLSIAGGTYAALYAQGTTTGFKLANNTISGLVRGVVITGGSSIQITNNTINQGSNIGLYVIAGTSPTVSNNTFVGASGKLYNYGIRFDSGVNGLTWSGNSITGWSLNSASDKVVYFNASPNVTSSSNTIGSSSTPNSGYGYYVNSVSGFSTTDDVIQYQPSTGIFITGTTSLSALRTESKNHTGNGSYGWQITNSSGTMTDTEATSNGWHGYYITGSSSITGSGMLATSNGTSSGMDGFWVQDTSSFTCTSCVASDSYKDGFSFNGGTYTIVNSLSYGNGVRDTTDNNGNGFTAHNTASGTIRYSIAYGNVKSGIGVIDASAGFLYNNVFYNNYRSVSCGSCSHYGEMYLNSSGAWTVKNNIASGAGLAFFTNAGFTGTYTASNNLYYSSGGSSAFSYRNGTATDLSGWKTASGEGASSQFADPLFTNVGTYDFTLQNTSPAINAGTDVGLTTDYVGNSVPSGQYPDIGAYEFQDSAAPTTTASVATGTYVSTQSVTLACNDGSGVGCATTYYTTDGATPTTSSTQYSGAISIAVTTTLKFFSRDSNLNAESVNTKTYAIDTTSFDPIEIAVGKSTSDFDEKVYSTKNTFKLKGGGDSLVNGTVKIYKDGRKIKTFDIGSDGEWSKALRLKDDFSGWLKVRQFNQDGTLLDTKRVKVKIDTEKPEFTSFVSSFKSVIPEVTKLTWEARDNKQVHKYKIYVGGRIFTTKYSMFQIPKEITSGIQYIKIKAYDKAGNTTSKETSIQVR